jgi:hypothetical protein
MNEMVGMGMKVLFPLCKCLIERNEI